MEPLYRLGFKWKNVLGWASWALVKRGCRKALRSSWLEMGAHIAVGQSVAITSTSPLRLLFRSDHGGRRGLGSRVTGMPRAAQLLDCGNQDCVADGAKRDCVVLGNTCVSGRSSKSR